MEELPSFAVALDAAKPKMTDTFNDTSEGTNMLVFWAHKNMTWADVGVPKNETSFGKVKQDSEAERGKRLCAGVSIVQIEKVVDRIYSGLASTGSWEIIRFYAVGSTGELVERSRTRFCGAVTGRHSYSNAGGGTSHAVQMVGMFDIEENNPKSRR